MPGRSDMTTAGSPAARWNGRRSTQLLDDIRAGQIDCVVVYKVDRLSRSLLDFAQLIALFDEHEVSFVSVTQQFNTTTSMGRLTLNILLSFAQFEREIIGERIRDKKLATARQGKYIGGQPVLGLDIVDKRYVVNRAEAKLVRRISRCFWSWSPAARWPRPSTPKASSPSSIAPRPERDFGGKPWKGRHGLQPADRSEVHRPDCSQGQGLSRRARGDCEGGAV